MGRRFLGVFFLSPIFMDKVTDGDAKKIPNYECKKCGFICCKKSDWERHLLTLKHKKVTVGDKKTPKKRQSFSCEICDFVCSNSNELDNHKSHSCQSQVTAGDTQKNATPIFFCDVCNKKYYSRNGLIFFASPYVYFILSD